MLVVTIQIQREVVSLDQIVFQASAGVMIVDHDPVHRRIPQRPLVDSDSAAGLNPQFFGDIGAGMVPNCFSSNKRRLARKVELVALP